MSEASSRGQGKGKNGGVKFETRSALKKSGGGANPALKSAVKKTVSVSEPPAKKPSVKLSGRNGDNDSPGSNIGAGKRRLTFIDDKTADANKVSRPVGSQRGPGDSKPGWYEELSEEQITMFKQLFELLDQDGGGSIDGEELYEVIKDLDLGVTKEEIVAVLRDLDKDGNGEIDFDEFLYCMSATDRFFGSLGKDEEDTTSTDENKYSKRQSMFFTAITKFAIKNSMGEIEQYYSQKARHVPHVIGHYTAGARLIGLSDRQIERHLAKIQKTSKGVKSPYAKPLRFVTLASKKTTKPKGKTGCKTGQGQFEHVSIGPDQPIIRPDRQQAVTMTTGSEDDVNLLSKLKGLADNGNIVAKLPEVHLVPQIRQKLKSGEIDEDHPIQSTLRAQRKSGEDDDKKTIPIGVKAKDSKRIWKVPRPQNNATKRNIVPLPHLKLDITGEPTIEDLSKIRQQVSAAVNDYYAKRKMRTMRSAEDLWNELHADRIQSKALQNNFRKTYRAYSPCQDNQAFVINPWIPEQRYTCSSPCPRSASSFL